MKYTTRLYMGFGLIILVVTILLAMIVGMFHNQNEEINDLVGDRYEKIKLLNHIRVNIKYVDRDLNDYIFLSHDDEDLQNIRESTMAVEQDLHILNNIIQVKAAKEQLMTINSLVEEYLTTVERTISFALIEDYSRASTFYQSAVEQYENIIESSEELIAIQERIMEDTLKNADNSYNLYLQISATSIILALLFGFGTSYWVIRSIKTRFRKNSIEAMPGGGRVTIETRLCGDRVVIAFKDNGLGIPRNRLQHLGKPFFTTKENGTGLGLMISYSIIENHQGELHIDSEEGRGTTVEVCLPVQRESRLLV